jgi:hypothetical protein
MAGGMQGQGGYRQGQGGQGTSGGVYDQARETMSDMAERASDMWDGAYDQGARYYRQGTRAVGNLDGGSLSLLIIGAAIGYAVAWMAHSDGWSQGRQLPDYSRGRGGGRRDTRNRH